MQKKGLQAKTGKRLADGKRKTEELYWASVAKIRNKRKEYIWFYVMVNLRSVLQNVHRDAFEAMTPQKIHK